VSGVWRLGRCRNPWFRFAVRTISESKRQILEERAVRIAEGILEECLLCVKKSLVTVLK
jgi:hypothetical protein